MTLNNYKFHKNSLQKSQKDQKSETIDITQWIPKELDKSIFDKEIKEKNNG